jgi:hypothetical protein
MTHDGQPEAREVNSHAAGQARGEATGAAQASAAQVGQTLRLVAAALGVLTAVCVSVLQGYGPVPAMLSVIPALIVAAPLALPAKSRGVAGLVSAAVLTVAVPFISAFAQGGFGLYFLPLVLLAWVAVLAPLAIRRGISRFAVRSWRLVAAAFVALPGLLVAISAATGTVDIAYVAAAMWIVGPLALGVLCARGNQVGYAVTAVLGALVMILAIVDRGALFAAFWLFGAVYLAIGVVGFVAARGESGGSGRLRGVSEGSALA